ncbi:uncharacterized protein [Cicer arietinum]|uniref:uncharacterized protein n=1 Tax=Cicer arietinum TaxID=3827 RepID=UPI003CC6CF17
MHVKRIVHHLEVMQHLLTLMERDKYVYRYKKVEGSNELRDIFWAHPNAIILVNNFHIELIMDNTYKTCRYQMSLLEIIGVTSTEMIFCVGFAYLQSERADIFTWALQMWSKLTFHVDASSIPLELSVKHEIYAIELDVLGKISLKGKLREIVYPSTTSMFPPVAKVKTKGAPTKDKIAALLGMGENCWAFICQQCVIELQEFMSQYEILFGGENYVRQLIHNVYVEQVASKDNWTTLPKMGYVIALKFNLVVVALSLNQSQTYFPLRSQPTTSMSNHRVIVISFVKNCHFVQVYLKSDSPKQIA